MTVRFTVRDWNGPDPFRPRTFEEQARIDAYCLNNGYYSLPAEELYASWNAGASVVDRWFESIGLPMPKEDATVIEQLKDKIGIEQERAVAAKLSDAATPGARIGFDPAEAERAGAFAETALSPEDAGDAEDGDAE